MSLVNVSNMTVLDNPAPFGNPLQFEITFECLQPLEDDLEWKVVYVGSAKSTSHDQVLDEILVGPVPVGINKFILQAEPPNASSIPDNDILGVTVILVTCSYREKEFLRVGYYVNNEYIDETNETNETEFDEEQEQGPPKPLDFQKVVRTILADKPRVTRFHIYWGDGADPSKGVEVEQTDDLQGDGIGNGQDMNGNGDVDGDFDGGFDQENGIMEDDNGEMDDEEDLDVDVDVDEEGEDDMEDEEDIEDDDMVATE